MSNRDTQRSRLYKADDVLKRWADRLTDHNDVERFVKHLLKSKRLRKAYPTAFMDPVQVKDRGNRNCAATGGSRGINIPVWARTTDVIIHELAHVIHSRSSGSYKQAAHGPEFCAIYLKLALYFMGREAHDAFKASMRAHKVRFTPKRKRAPLSPEKKAELLARLDKARKIKAVNDIVKQLKANAA